MLSRFDSTVLTSGADLVVILGGINDIGQGFSVDSIVANIATMAQRADEAGIRVVLCSVMPADTYYTQLVDAQSTIPLLTEKILALAQQNGYLYADYYDEMLDGTDDGLPNMALFKHGLHPNAAGYEVMWGVLQPLFGGILGAASRRSVAD